jgi:hypothetical protein
MSAYADDELTYWDAQLDANYAEAEARDELMQGEPPDDWPEDE